jgi:DNA primase
MEDLMAFVDFSALKEKVKIEDVCQLYDLNQKWRGPQGRGPCPACPKGDDRVLAVNTAKASFYCFSARTGGDLISMVAHTQGISQRDAAADIAKRVGLDNSSTNSPAPSNSGLGPKDISTEGLIYLDNLLDIINELEQRVTALEDAKIIKLRATP